jgi:hypothetical protein
VADLPRCLWFPDTRQLRIARSEPDAHIHVSVDPPGRLLGEMMPPRSPLAVFLLDVPPGTSFRIVQNDRRHGPELAATPFAPGPSLNARLPQGGPAADRLVWFPGGWQRVDVRATVWSERGLRNLEQRVIPAADGGLRLPPEWRQAQTELILTPFDADERQGPSEVVSLAVIETMALRNCLAGAGLGWAPRVAGGVERLRRWPAPVLDALCRSLIGLPENNRVPVQDLACRCLGLPVGPGGFIKAYEQAPGVVHLLASNLHLAALALRHGLPPRDRGDGVDLPCTAAALVARAAGGPPGDPELERLLEERGVEEIAFWVRVLYGGPVSPHLRRLRVVRRCSVEPEEAPELSAQLTALESEPLEEISAELLPDDASPLRQAAAVAAAARVGAVSVPTSAEAIRTAVGAVANLRTLLAEHLQALMAERPNWPWSELREPLRLVSEAGRPLNDAARLLAQLRQGAPEVEQTPAVDPPCLLRVDAVWLAQRQRRQRDARERLGKAMAWCRGVLLDARLVQPGRAGRTENGEAGALPQLWQEWRTAWNGLDAARLFPALRVPGGRQVRDNLVAQLARIQNDLPPPEDEPSAAGVREVLAGMSGETTRLTAWLMQEDLRRAAREELDRLDSGLRSREARGGAATLLDEMRGLVAGPVSRWQPLTGRLEELSAVVTRERESEETWARLMACVPADLLDRLGLSGVNPLDRGLDPFVAGVAEVAAVVEADLETETETLRRSLKQLRDAGRPLGLTGTLPDVAEAVTPEDPAPAFAAEAYRSLLDLLHRRNERETLTLQTRELRRRLEEGLEARLSAVLPVPEADGSALRTAPDWPRLVAVLRTMLEAGDVAGLAGALERLPLVVAALADRVDLLGLERTPTGAELIRPAQSVHWLRHRSDAPLVELLRGLAELPFEPIVLLTEPERL